MNAAVRNLVSQKVGYFGISELKLQSFTWQPTHKLYTAVKAFTEVIKTSQ